MKKTSNFGCLFFVYTSVNASSPCDAQVRGFFFYNADQDNQDDQDNSVLRRSEDRGTCHLDRMGEISRRWRSIENDKIAIFFAMRILFGQANPVQTLLWINCLRVFVLHFVGVGSAHPEIQVNSPLLRQERCPQGGEICVRPILLVVAQLLGRHIGLTIHLEQQSF